MSENNYHGGGGVGLSGLLTVAFIVLKLTGVIHWRWVWVLAPLWIDLAIVLLLLAIIAILNKLSDLRRRRIRRKYENRCHIPESRSGSDRKVGRK